MKIADLNWPACAVGTERDHAPIEWADTMKALVYFGKGRFEVIPDRPIVGTAFDVIARVERVYRCGTDVKIFQSGRPDQCEESLFDELRSIFNLNRPHRDGHFLDYARLLLDGESPGTGDDPLFTELRARVDKLDAAERKSLADRLRTHWGRILGHETVVTIERVGSRVGELTEGIGYWGGRTLDPGYLDFRPGQRCVLQSRIAHYMPPPTSGTGRPAGGDLVGVQLLGGNITDLAMNLGGAYAQRVRLTPPIIQSGSIIRVPDGVPDGLAALAEPTACLLDCFQKTAHELGQDDHGSVLCKGVMPGGTTCVVGSGAMALMAVMLALIEDRQLGMAPAAEVVVVVRSPSKAELVRKILPDPRVITLVCPDEAQVPDTVVRDYGPIYQQRTGQPFRGFDDVILGAGSAATVAMVHDLIAPTGARIMTFAGTRGPCSIESGVWHYANAGVLGTSGSNTKMLELALGLFKRTGVPVERLAGKAYSFADLATADGIRAFFEDKHLRPCLLPNA